MLRNFSHPRSPPVSAPRGSHGSQGQFVIDSTTNKPWSVGSTRQVMLSLEVTKMYVRNGCPALKNQKRSSVSILTALSGFRNRINPSLGLAPGTLMLSFFLHFLKTFLSSQPWASQLFSLCFPKCKRNALWKGVVEVVTTGLQRYTAGAVTRSHQECSVSKWSYTQVITRSHLKIE